MYPKKSDEFADDGVPVIAILRPLVRYWYLILIAIVVGTVTVSVSKNCGEPTYLSESFVPYGLIYFACFFPVTASSSLQVLPCGQ